MYNNKICYNCMAGVMINGVCNSCGKMAENPEMRYQNALPAGWRLQEGRYYLGRVLGSGGFGITYLAWDTKNNRRVAIKEFYFRSAVQRNKDTGYIKVDNQYEEFHTHLRERFMQEAHLLNKMRNYGNIINVYHLFEENNTVYYSMEFLEGQDLKSHFLQKQRALSWEELSPIIFEVLGELEVLHSNGLFHRDISPDNIFLLNDGKVRLIDFGSVRNYTFNNRFTTIYKQAFAPIEFETAESNQGPWSDIFSLSVTMYYLLTAKMPKNSVERMTISKMYGKDPRIPISTICPNLPVNVANAIDKGMNLYAEDRPQTVSDFNNALFPKKNTNKIQYIIGTNGLFKGKKIGISNQGVFRVGRGNETDRGKILELLYPANFTNVSRRHCSFVVSQDGSFWICDDQSTNGVYINWKRIVPGRWYLLKKDDVICLSNTEMYRVL